MTLSTAMTSFSAVQGRLLSKLAPSTMSFAAFAMSALASTRAGGLPAPAPIAFLPLDSTACTMPGPPVATSSRTSLCCIIALVFSMDGSATVTIRFGGAPAATRARLSSRISQWLMFVARGCGLNTTALPAASMPMALLMMVSVGLVVGVIAPITPNGEISTVVRPSSPDHASVTRSSVPGVSSAAARFFAILSATLPMPVSSTAPRAMRSRCSGTSDTSRITATNRARSFIEQSR